MIIVSSLRPGMYIQNNTDNIVYKIKHMTNTTITLEQMSTGTIIFHTKHSIKPNNYTIVDLQSDYMYT